MMAPSSNGIAAKPYLCNLNTAVFNELNMYFNEVHVIS